MTASIDEGIQRYYSINPKQFSVLTSLIISQEVPLWEEPPILSLEIILKPYKESGKSLRLKFIGVRNLVVKQPPFSIFTVPLLEISSIKEMQWETAKYVVKEPEEESISFTCQEFDFVLL